MSGSDVVAVVLLIEQDIVYSITVENIEWHRLFQLGRILCGKTFASSKLIYISSSMN